MTRRVMSHRISPAKKCVDAKRASARTFTSAYHFHNESQMIKTEFARRAVSTRDNSLSLFHWIFWIATSPHRRWKSSHTFSLVIRMSSYLVGASNTFLLEIIWILNPRWGDEMVWHQSEARHAFWSEMISCWVYKDRNIISIMKRGDWSTNSNSHAFQQWDDFLLGVSILKQHFYYEKEWMVSWENEGCYWVRKDGTHFFAGYSVNERIKDWYYRTSAVAQQSRQSSWKRWFLLERWRWKAFSLWKSIKIWKLSRLHEKELQALFFWTYPYGKR